MDNLNLLPIIIIGLPFQLAVQFEHIKKCLANNRLSDLKKILWVIAIVIFNLLGVIMYLVFNRKKTLYHSVIQTEHKSGDKVDTSIFLGLIIAYGILAVAIINQNPDNSLISALLGVTLLISILNHYTKIRSHKLVYHLLPLSKMLMVIIVDYLAVSSDFKIIIIITVASIINEYPLNYSKVFIWIPLILYQGASTLKYFQTQDIIVMDDLILIINRNVITYILVVLTFYVAKRQLVLNDYLQILIMDVKEKTNKLEEVSVIKERNRIARDIHDTLGHSLTGVIIQLEAAKNMIDVDKDQALELIDKAQSITRNGFSDVKRAIKALRPIMIEDNSLIESLEFLFERTEKDFDYRTQISYDLPENISDELKVTIYRFFQEFITNSLRHGKATHLKVNIEYQENMLRINCTDNGIGCNVIKEGYGLTGIRERIELLKGQVFYSSQIGNGFNTIIYVPIE